MDNIGGSANRAGSFIAHDVLLLLVIIGAMVGVLAVGIVFGVKLRNRRRRNRGHGHSSRESRNPERRSREAGEDRGDTGEGEGEGDDGETGSESGSSRGTRRRRRRRRDHRPRNPSLAESGGLPPPRAEDAPPPGATPFN